MTCTPQWSPPFRGGMTSPGYKLAEYLAGAAMEPALQGRDDIKDSRLSACVCTAAMEPALQGRDDVRLVVGGASRTRAAMEPALQGRDDALQCHLDILHRRLPQWSPPFRGGMTLNGETAWPDPILGRNGARPSGAG